MRGEIFPVLRKIILKNRLLILFWLPGYNVMENTSKILYTNVGNNHFIHCHVHLWAF